MKVILIAVVVTLSLTIHGYSRGLSKNFYLRLPLITSKNMKSIGGFGDLCKQKDISIFKVLQNQAKILASIQCVEEFEHILPGTMYSSDIDNLFSRIMEDRGSADFASFFTSQFPAIDYMQVINERSNIKLTLGDANLPGLLQRYIERPAQRLVVEILKEGGCPQWSNAYGEGLKGVYWDKNGTHYFTPLTEMGYFNTELSIILPQRYAQQRDI